MTRRTTRTLVVLVVALAAVAGIGLAARAVWDTGSTEPAVTDTCTVDGFDLVPDQAAVASTMVGAVRKFGHGLPERATVLVLAAALQESKLTNLAPGDGDRDSVGVLQQRPSQGWGSIPGRTDTIAARTARLRDVGEATREFLAALIKISGWQQLALADAVQAVQISADGQAYAVHEPEAQALADALQGIKPAGIACSFAAPTEVATAAVVAAQARSQLGIDTPVGSGRTVRVPGAHWQTASWFVANADRLGIDEVAYAGRRWTRGRGIWRPDKAASTAAVTATLSRRPA